MELRELLETHLPPSLYWLKIVSPERLYNLSSISYLTKELRIEIFDASLFFKTQLTCYPLCDAFSEPPLLPLQYCHNILYSLCAHPMVIYAPLHYLSAHPQSFSSVSSSMKLLLHQKVWKEENDWRVLLCGEDLLAFFLIQRSLPIAMSELAAWFFCCPSVLSLLLSKTQSASVASSLLSDLPSSPTSVTHELVDRRQVI